MKNNNIAAVALFALALLIGLPSAAQGPLTGDQLAARALRPDCIFPDLRYNPTFRVCAGHLMDGDREAFVSANRYGVDSAINVKLRDYDGVPLSRYTYIRLYESWLTFGVTAAAGLGANNNIPGWPASDSRKRYSISVDVVFRSLQTFHNFDHGPFTSLDQYVTPGEGIVRVPVHWPPFANGSCARDPDCHAAYPWYWNQWNELTAEQVTAATRRIKNYTVNEQCDLGPTETGGSGDTIVLTLREDGRISARCERATGGSGAMPKMIQPENIAPASRGE